MLSPGLFSHRPYWAHRFGTSPFLPRTRQEMDALGWEACDIILVTGDAYVDHPSFGMAIVGRLLEAQGFRVGILDQPNWNKPERFTELGEPVLFFGVTGGNMDSLVNHYTSDKKPRSDDAYTPGGLAGKRPDRASIVYTHRCKEAYPEVPIILGGIEGSLRRLAHYDYWSEKVRRSLLVDSGADLLIYGNAERALVDIAHRISRGENIREILDIRGTAVRRKVGATGPIDAEPGEFLVQRSDQFDEVGVVDPLLDPYATEEEMRTWNALQENSSGPESAKPEESITPEVCPKGGEMSAKAPPGTLVQLTLKQKARHPRHKTIIRLPSWEEVKKEPSLYAHANRIFHLEANPHNARVLVQRNGDIDVYVNPPAFPLTTPEMDQVYELPYQKIPHPAHQGEKIPAYEMIRFSVTIMRGCFGGCSFCSITEHEGRIMQNRSEGSILREVEGLKEIPGFTGAVSDLGGPTANMYRLACKSRRIEASCRKPSCVYPGICSNLNTDHKPLIELYRKARKIPGIKKIAIASGLRYDLAVESPEYIKELVTHHVGGYLKIAPEHVAQGPLSKMMKPGIGTYDRFKELFERYSKEAGKKQYLIPYFIAAHPGTKDEDMLELAQWLKKNGYRADQVQAFLPSPMSYATAMYHTQKDPLRPLRQQAGETMSVVKSAEQRTLHKAFLRFHDAKNWPLLRRSLRKMGRGDLIGSGPDKLVPAASQRPTTGAHAGRNQHRLQQEAKGKSGSRKGTQRFATTHTGLPQFGKK